MARFAKILPEYKAAPEITRERLYIETMEKVLSHTRKVLVNDSKNGNLMVLPLDQMLKGVAAPAAKSDSSDASDLLRLPPASSSSSASTSSTSSSTGVALWTNAALTRSVTTTSVRGITMRKSVIAIIVIVLVVLYMSVFVVKEGERGITLRFGKVLRDDENKPLVYAPGLHFKIPFIESVKMLDARIQTMDNQADRFVTKEKKDLIVDSYIKWRISDFSRYYGNRRRRRLQAEVLLKRKFSDRLRSEIGRLDVKDIVTDSRGRLTTEVRDALNSGSAGTEDEVSTPAADDAIAKAAERVEAETNGKVQVINPNSMAALGIEVVDVRIKQINLPAEVSEAIYNRMRAEREAVARRHRSQGQEEAEKLRATADYEVTKTLAEAERRGRILRGEGDAESAKLFADAFSRSVLLLLYP